MATAVKNGKNRQAETTAGRADDEADHDSLPQPDG